MLHNLQDTFLFNVLQGLAFLLVLIMGLFVVAVIVLYVLDKTQTQHAILRNYPVIGHFRYFFEHLGEFFRQYFFAMDREELPFNRAQRSWAYRAAKNIDNTVAFGSTRDLRAPGSVLFVNCPYPTLGTDAAKIQPVTIGPDCQHPWTTRAIFGISGMSYGALSAPAIKALSKGAHLSGIWMNTGEGGLSPYHLEGGCDIIFQVGTAKNGVRDLQGKLSDDKLREVAKQVCMFEIKLSQGAKPGKGGILPGAKVTPEIAKVRGIEVGKDALSPNRHPEINNNSELLDMVNHIRDVTGKPVGFKVVMGAHGWLDTLFEEIGKQGHQVAPDFITVDGGDGGSGAAPMPLIDSMGLPLREGLPLLVNKLISHGLKERVKVFASGKLTTPSDVAWALCLGADFCVSARGFMFALGCIQALQCNKNTCPTGITTHNKKLQAGLVPKQKAQRVANYADNLTHEVCIIAHACGTKEPRELRRYHARVVTEAGLSIPLNQLHPEPPIPDQVHDE